MTAARGNTECIGTCWVEIDLDALRRNYRHAINILPPGTSLTAVIKADGYGLGAVPVGKVMLAEGAEILGVATVGEGRALRKAGLEGRILVLGRMNASEVDRALRWDLEVSIPRMGLAEKLSGLAVRKGVTVPVHLKIDTGMTRLGVPWDTAHDEAIVLNSMPGLKLSAVFTHFANADLADREFTKIQIDRLKSIIKQLRDSGIDVPFHMANSAAILTSQSPENCGARPGIMLYGSSPSESVYSGDLTPILTWKCRVLQVKNVPPGTGISYGHDYVTDKETTIATISVGYADGYMRRLSNRGQVLISGQRAPVVGRVTMDMTMVDVTDIQDVEAGDEVVIIGKQGDECILAEEVAAWADTINYEIYCALSHRVRRVYLNNE